MARPSLLYGHTEVVRLLINGDAAVDARGSKNWTPLHLAAVKGHIEVVHLLIDSGAAADARQSENWTPLHFAAQNGYVEVVRLLIHSGAAVDARQSEDRTPLHVAAQNGQVEVVRLIGNGAAVDARESKDCSSLHVAAQNGHIEVVGFLLESGAGRGTHCQAGWPLRCTQPKRGTMQQSLSCRRRHEHHDPSHDEGNSSLFCRLQNHRLTLLTVAVDLRRQTGIE